MRKIPSLFIRDWDGDPEFVTREIDPKAAWVFSDPDVVATRKYDGTCVMFDGEGWWARREIKPGKATPEGFMRIETDDVTERVMGWIPMATSSYAKFHAEALDRMDGFNFQPGTYELIGPRIGPNPEKLSAYYLQPHDQAQIVDLPMSDYDSVHAVVHCLRSLYGHEGIVWHHPDGRMAKAKARDFRRDQDGVRV